MPMYDAEVDPGSDNTSHALMLRLVGPDKRVLDVGCATGYLGEALIAQGCRVSGVELDPEAARRAQKVLDEVLVADLETTDLVEHFGAGSFDVVVFGDVLEHLREPQRLLRNAVGLLAPHGSVVISVPNVTHAALRLALLQGRWTYSDRGLLDRTHVTFFTRSSLLELLRDSGLAAVDVRASTAGTFATEIAVDASDLPDGVVEWIERQPDADAYQFVLRAIKDDADGAVEALRVRFEEARGDVRRTAERLDTVTAELGRTAAELEARRAEVDRLEAAARDADERTARTQEALDALSSTRTVRALRRPRQAYGWLRRRVRR